MVYNSNECRNDYAMPLIGNGTMLPSESVAAESCLTTNYIWWAGRRYIDFLKKTDSLW